MFLIQWVLITLSSSIWLTINTVQKPRLKSICLFLPVLTGEACLMYNFLFVCYRDSDTIIVLQDLETWIPKNIFESFLNINWPLADNWLHFLLEFCLIDKLLCSSLKFVYTPTHGMTISTKNSLWILFSS